MGALVGFVSEDTENFLFLLTYTQKNATAFGKMNQIYTESVAQSIGISRNSPQIRREFHIIRHEIDKNFTLSVAKSTRISQNPHLGKCILAHKKILAQYSRGKLSEEGRV